MIKNHTLFIADEEIFLINLLFKKKEIRKERFNNLNYEKLVKVTSSHLLLPSLYINLKKKGYLNYIPEELSKYLREIYLINANRNKLLIDEAEKISEVLNKNNIKHIFFKGTRLIREKIYTDIGERMIGDIDFLIDKKDIIKINDVLEKNEYYNNYIFKFFKSRHLPRYTNSNKLFALEPHFHLFSKTQKLINEKILINSDYFNNDLNQLINILSFQINDYGSFKANYSLRVIYDFYTMSKNKEFNISQYLDNDNIRKFIIVTNMLKITNIKIETNHFEKIFSLRFLLKNSNKYMKIIDHLLCLFVINSCKIPSKIIEFIINRKYRRFFLLNIFK